MSDELSSLFHAAAREETVAAKREFPFGATTLTRFARDVRRRKQTRGVVYAAAAIPVIAGFALGIGWLGHFGPLFPGNDSPNVSPSPSVSTPSPSVSASPTPSSSPSLSPSPSPSPSPTYTSTPPPPPPDNPVVVPDRVTGVSTPNGGGSGEILVDWDTVEGADGYRVYRSSDAGGPFTRAASVNAATGATTIEFGGSYEYISIWPPSSSSFEYVEVVPGGPAYFQVAAFNSAGEGPRSTVVCAVPYAQEGSC
jgi:hypothetical protein